MPGDVDPWRRLKRHQKLARIGLGVAFIGVFIGAFDYGFGLIGISLGMMMFGIAMPIYVSKAHRKHSNRKGLRQIKRGKTARQVEQMAKELGIPYRLKGYGAMKDDPVTQALATAIDKDRSEDKVDGQASGQSSQMG